MNQTMQLLLNRKSVRAYQAQEIRQDDKDQIIAAALRAPTAGNLMLYSIIEVSDQTLKDKLVTTCDNQPFIARARLVLLFLADFQRWMDTFQVSGVERLCQQNGVTMRKPQPGDLFLACCDALIAAQTTVIAAESLGIGSCYIGDIMENYETHKTLFDLPDYVFPISLVCFGHPTQQQQERAQTTRFDQKYIVFENRYHRFDSAELEEMTKARGESVFAGRDELQGAKNLGQWIYLRKFGADFSKEMNRSVRAMLRVWCEV
jgi:nitroreductase